MNTKQLPVTFNQRVGANVQRFRKITGMSQAELGRALGRHGFGKMEQQVVLMIENGRRPLKCEEAEAIAQVLGVDYQALTTPADDRSGALAQIRAAELAIASINADRDAEYDRHRREIERLTDEITQHEQKRQAAAAKLVELLTAEGRPDLASVYADLAPAEEMISMVGRNGQR
jgi:transcriptional regulator with XRE-family HTH domain